MRYALPQRTSLPHNVSADISIKCKCAQFSLLTLRHVCSICQCHFSVRYLEGKTRPEGQLDEGHTYPVLRHSASCPSEETSMPAEPWVLSGRLHPGRTKTGKMEVSVLESVQWGLVRVIKPSLRTVEIPKDFVFLQPTKTFTTGLKILCNFIYNVTIVY